MRVYDNISENLSACDVEFGSATKFTILPGEDPLEFERLRKEIVQELVPDGPIEEDLVLTVAKCIWRKWRYQRFLAIKAAAAQFDPAHEAYNEPLGLMTLVRLLDGAKLGWEIREFLDLQKKHFTAHLNDKCPEEKFPTPVAWRKALQKEIREVLIPNATRFGLKPRGVLLMEASAILTDDLLAREVECEERMDRTMEQALERLAKVKAAKRKGAYREVQRLALVHPAPIAK